MIALPSEVDPEFSQESLAALHLDPLSGTLSESLVKSMPDDSECDTLAYGVFQEFAYGRLIDLFGQCQTVVEICVGCRTVACSVFDPFVFVKVRDVTGEVTIHQFEGLWISVDIRERAPLVEFVSRYGLLRYIAVGIAARLRPEAMQGQVPGIPSPILPALLFFAVGFAEGILPAEDEEFCCASLFSI